MILKDLWLPQPDLKNKNAYFKYQFYNSEKNS